MMYNFGPKIGGSVMTKRAALEARAAGQPAPLVRCLSCAQPIEGDKPARCDYCVGIYRSGPIPVHWALEKHRQAIRALDVITVQALAENGRLRSEVSRLLAEKGIVS